MPSSPRPVDSRCSAPHGNVLPILASIVALALGVAPPSAAQETTGADAPAYSRASQGTRLLEGPGVAIKVLVEAANFGGGEVEVAELTLQPGSTAATHRHGSHELIYVLEGVLDHVVNGETHRLEPGMVGIVKLGDTVAHKVASQTPVKAVLVWAPGGEADRLAKMFKATPVDAQK